MYSIQINKNTIHKQTAKGISNHVVKREFTHELYSNALENNELYRHEQMQIISKKHIIKTVRQKKVSICPFYDKQYILDGGIDLLPFGHYSLNDYQ